MLVGCLAGGLTIAILGTPFGGVRTQAFAFTSLLTIPVFDPMWVYMIAIAVAFTVAMLLIIVTGYKDKEPVAEAAAVTAATDLPAGTGADGTAEASSDGAVSTATRTVVLGAPVAGTAVSLDDVADKVFASRALGEGVGVQPGENRFVSPVDGELVTVTGTGHAFGIKTDTGVEVLVHIGIDTVQMDGEGFTVAVEKGQRVSRGDLLATVDLDAVTAAGYDTTTLITVTNTKSVTDAGGEVLPRTGTVSAGDPIVEVNR